MYWGIENVDGSLPGDEKKKEFYLTDFESDRDYYRRLCRAQYRSPRYYSRKPIDLNFGALPEKPRCKPGYQLMRSRTTGKYKCIKKGAAPRTTKSSSRCPPGYKLMKHKKTGKYKCFKPAKKYPWMVFPRSGGPFGLVGSVGRVGNFIFMILMIGVIIYFAPTIVRAVTSIAKGTIDVYGRWKEVKSIPTKEALGMEE